MAQSARVAQQQFQQLCALREEAKGLKLEITKFKRAARRGDEVPDEKVAAMRKRCKKEEEATRKAMHEVEVLKKAREQDRRKHGRKVREVKGGMHQLKKELQDAQEKLLAKERESREQVLASKKLKRQLRQLIMSGASGGGGDGIGSEYPPHDEKMAMLYGTPGVGAQRFRIQGGRGERERGREAEISAVGGRRREPQPPVHGKNNGREGASSFRAQKTKQKQRRVNDNHHASSCSAPGKAATRSQWKQKQSPIGEKRHQRRGDRKRNSSGGHAYSPSLSEQLMEQSEEDLEEAAAALSLQCAFRGMQGRSKARHKREERGQEIKQYQQDQAASRLQARYRGYSTRSKYGKSERSRPPYSSYADEDFEDDDFEDDFNQDGEDSSSLESSRSGYVPSIVSNVEQDNNRGSDGGGLVKPRLKDLTTLSSGGSKRSQRKKKKKKFF